MENRAGILFFYIGAISFTLGIFVQSHWAINLPTITWLMLLAFVLALVAWRRRQALTSPMWLMVISLSLFVVGMMRFEVATWNEVVPEHKSQLGREVTVEGVVIREPDIRERIVQLYVKTEASLLLVSTDRFTTYQYGDRITATGVLEKPRAFATDLGRTFNYPGYLKARGVSYQMPFSEVTIQNRGEGNWLLAQLFNFKQRFMSAVELQLPEPSAGLGEGLLLGVKRALGEELERDFRRTGIIHIVVLSGYNVMLVVAFVLYLLGFWLRSRATAIAGILGITLFALLVGLSATVVRASIMAGLLLLLQATGRVYAIMRALVLAGLVMLIINPYLLVFDVGFQLSFLATLGLIVLAPKLVQYFSFVPTLFGAREFLVATIATQLFVMPVLLYQIGEFSLVSVAVNVLVLPMVPVAMLLTFVVGMTGLMYAPLAVPIAFLAHLSLGYIVSVASWFADVPYAAITVPAFSGWVVPLLYLSGAGLWWWLNKKKKEPDPLAEWTIIPEEEYRQSLKT